MEKNNLSVLESVKMVPKHIAIIMDGNGRWAKMRSLPRLAGHRAGVEAVRRVVRACAELQVKTLVLYAFSVENWRRPEQEVEGLLWLIRKRLRKEIKEMDKDNVRFDTIGDLRRFPDDIQGQIQKAVYKTRKNSGLQLYFALNYGSRSEIVEATRNLCRDIKSGLVRSNEIDEPTFARYLYTADIPDPDLLIRTSGEMRLSNFLLWQVAHSEIWVTPVLWPDFNKSHLLEAIEHWHRKQVT